MLKDQPFNYKEGYEHDISLKILEMEVRTTFYYERP